MDTNRHIKMVLSHYDCFGANQAAGVANECDGSFLIEVSRPRPDERGVMVPPADSLPSPCPRSPCVA